MECTEPLFIHLLTTVSTEAFDESDVRLVSVNTLVGKEIIYLLG